MSQTENQLRCFALTPAQIEGYGRLIQFHAEDALYNENQETPMHQLMVQLVRGDATAWVITNDGIPVGSAVTTLYMQGNQNEASIVYLKAEEPGVVEAFAEMFRVYCKKLGVSGVTFRTSRNWKAFARRLKAFDFKKNLVELHARI